VPLVNYATREITCKIVYYGPGRSGKTTNLRHLHGRLPADRAGQLVSLATEGDRTLFFDFLALDLGVVAGFATRFQLYTVPGQSYYAATRRLVLQGVDGVVFVADSRRRQLDENVESLCDLHEQLAALASSRAAYRPCCSTTSRTCRASSPRRPPRWPPRSTSAARPSSRPTRAAACRCSRRCARPAASCSAACPAARPRPPRDRGRRARRLPGRRARD
jgi:hypothetical protein